MLRTRTLLVLSAVAVAGYSSSPAAAAMNVDSSVSTSPPGSGARAF